MGLNKNRVGAAGGGGVLDSVETWLRRRCRGGGGQEISSFFCNK